MSAPSITKDPRPARVQSANDRLKAQWDLCLTWSIVGACTLHVALFAFSPEWLARSPAQAASAEYPALRWLLLDEPTSAPEGTLTPVAAVALDVDSIPGEAEAGVPTSGAEEREMERALRDRIFQRGGAALPTLAQSTVESDMDESGSAGTTESGLSVRNDLSLSDYPSLEELSAVAADRLSGLRPDIALQAHSSWLLLRNPREVNDFLSRQVMRGELPADAQGWVSVALWVTETGAVEWAEIARSSGRRELDETTLAMVNEVAAFWPARTNGVAEATSMILTVIYPWF